MKTTRTETIDGHVYCAYCGKELKNPHYGICPEPPTICNCEKAKEELDLYDKVRELYNYPLAESLIDIKVTEYRNSLLNKRNLHCVSTTITGSTCGDASASLINLMDNDAYTNLF